MKQQLKFLFDFQFVIADMQSKIIEARRKGTKEDVLNPSIERVDKLIEIYKTFDKYYYSAHFEKQKNIKLEHDIIELSEQISALQEENKKLLESIEWNPQP